MKGEYDFLKGKELTIVLLILFGATLAAAPSFATSCTATGYFRDGINLTASILVTTTAKISGELNAFGCDIGVYFAPGSSGSVVNANIHDARYFGVLVHQASVDLNHSAIHDIGDHPRDGAQHGVAVYYATTDAGSPSSQPSCIVGSTLGDVDHNSIYDYQNGGIAVNCLGSKVMVNYNVVDGTGAPSNNAAAGIQIGFGAVSEVDHNNVSGNECNNPTACGPDLVNVEQSAGILLYLAGSGTEVDHNNLTSNDIGIALLANNTQIDSDQLTNNRYGGIVLFGSSNNVIDYNQVKGGSTLPPYSAGMDLLQNSNNNNVNHNQIQVTSVPPIYIDDSSTGNPL